MRIGQLAAQTGFSVRTIRFYEQSGLLPAPPRTEGGYRVYDQDAVARLRFVRSAQTLGLSLAEIAEVLRIRDHQPRFFIGVAGVALNYSLVILIMVCRLVGRAVGRLSRRCAGFHAPAGVFHDRRGDGMVVRSVRGSP